MRTHRLWFATLALHAAACADSGPSREAVSGRRLWASSYGELIATDGDRGSLAVTPPSLDRVGEVVVGARPGQIVELDDRLWVTLRGERKVVSLVRRGGAWVPDGHVDVGAEPVGLAADGVRQRLYVASTQADTVSVIDLATSQVVTTVPVAGGPRSVVVHPSGRVFVGTERDGRVVVMEPGALTPQLVPVPSGRNEVTGTPLTLRITGDLALSPDGRVLEVPGAYLDPITPFSFVETTAPYYKGEPGSLHFKPVVVDVALAEDGQPEPEGVTVTMLFEGSGDGSMPTSVAYAGDQLLVTLESRGEVLALDAEPSRRLVGGRFQVVHLDTAGLAEGVVVDGDGTAFVSSRLLRTIARLDGTRGIDQLESPLDAEARRGRQLFFASTDPSMSADGITCGSCHYDGRTDGLSWTFPRGVRQTPSLAERVTERTPLRWGGDRATVAEDAALTAPLMGGAGLSDADARAVESFVRTLPQPDLPGRGVVNAAVTRGAAVFAKAGCASCHAGELLTDGKLHALAGRTDVLTPSLLGVSATPPYLYDGSLATLREVVERADELGHSAGAIEPADVDALVAYLSSR